MVCSLPNVGMEVVKDNSKDILKFIQTTDLYFELVQTIEKESSKSSCDQTKLYKNLLESILAKESVVNQIENAILEYKQKSAMALAVGEEISIVRQAQTNWQRRIVRSINSMCSELNLFLSRRRSDKSRRNLSENWTEMASEENILTEGRNELQGIKPIYGARDLLEVVSSIGLPSENGAGGTSSSSMASGGGGNCNEFLGRMMLVQLSLPVLRLDQMRDKFKPPIAGFCVEFGIDDVALPPTAPSLVAAMNGIKGVVASGNAKRLSLILRNAGCPPSQRRSAWMLLLGINAIDSFKCQYYEQLKNAVIEYDLLLDYVLYKGIQKKQHCHLFIFHSFFLFWFSSRCKTDSVEQSPIFCI